MANALQVIFDALVAAETPGRLIQRRNNTECYVHALLENQRRHGGGTRGSLEGIEESRTDRAGTSASTHEGSTVEPKSDGESQENLGQEDEISWQKRHADKGKQSGDQSDDGRKFDISNLEEHAVHSRLLTKKQLSGK
jgi:NAD+ kinase